MDEINAQLSQMKAALELAADEDKPGIQMIIDQLEELLGVYASTETSTAREDYNNDTSNGGGGEEEEVDEYKLFQAEIAALNSSENPAPNQSSSENSLEANNRLQPALSTTATSSGADPANKSIGNELEALIGMKCMAPHQENWGQIGYYSAMISSVLSLEGGDNDDDENQPNDLSSIMVRVIFIQPVVKSMLFCPFYKEDKCRFSDQDCKFSHGEIVSLAQLRDYTEPDYSAIIPGSRVLAKYHDDLWYKATVQRITEDGDCEVSYDVGNEALTVPLHETSLLDENGADDDDLSTTSSSEDDVQNPNISSSDSEDDIPKSLLTGGLNDGMLDMRGDSALGDWEKYTKGFGSKLMMKMGYVMGTGLGRHREGRVEPVDAIVLPQGKSLDACMELKERAKDGNLFSAEKQRLKRQRREAKQREKIAVQDKLKEDKATSMFNFLNEKLALRKNTTGNKSNNQSNNLVELRKESSVSLNKRALGVHENLRQVGKDIQKTKESMKRQKGRDKETYSILEKKLEELEGRRRELNKVQSSVAKEQKQRSDKRKLVLF